jgi:hypothetical protein
MTLTRQLAFLLVAWALLLGSSCQKQKKAQLPPKMPAPTLTVSVPDQIPEIEEPEQPQAPQQEATAEEAAPKKAPAKHRNAKKPTQPPPANQASSTVAVNHPPANPVVEAPAPDIAIAAVSNPQVVWFKQNTTELLDTTEKDLKGLNHGLGHDEEAMLTQIKSYIAQSRSATKDGDFERAYNLALKAHLLADALIKK